MIKEYRRHQAKAEEISSEIHSGARDQKIVTAYVTPGGGKTLMASIFAHQLLKGDVERVLVVCPRVTLQSQMRNGFNVPSLGLTGSLAEGHRRTRSLLKDDLSGCVTTYQDLVSDAQRGNKAKWLQFVSEIPTLLVLDEAHHLQSPDWAGAESSEEKGWAPAVAPLVNAASRVLLMTGTMTRDNGSSIAFIQYDKDRKPQIDINYTRRDALDEQAILNISVKLCDGDARYWHRFRQHRHLLSKASGKNESRALSTLLSDAAYRNKVLDDALSEFAQYRSTRNANARMIVICANQAQAKSVRDHLRNDGSYRSVLAISDEKDAHIRLARFRDRREGEILVTVGMAYEGLDVPDCTHLVALTSIRSRPWLEQALSRVTRFDPKCALSWEEQCAYLYVPNDHSMVSFLSEWIDEQDARFADPPEAGGEQESRDRKTTFSPISGELTGVRYADTYHVFSDDEQDLISRFDREFKLLGHLPAVERLRLAKRMKWES